MGEGIKSVKRRKCPLLLDEIQMATKILTQANNQSRIQQLLETKEDKTKPFANKQAMYEIFTEILQEHKISEEAINIMTEAWINSNIMFKWP